MVNDYPEIKAKNNQAKKLIVLLHGLGSDGHDLTSLISLMQTDLADFHFISPHAPEKYDLAPFGWQWFSVQDRSPAVIDQLATKSVIYLKKLIQAKQQELAIKNSDTFILGFSQGAMMGVKLVLEETASFAAMISLSGRLLPNIKLINKKTPICIIHGSEDMIVEVEASKKLAEYCENHQIAHELLLVPNLNHSIDYQMIKFAINFIKKLNK